MQPTSEYDELRPHPHHLMLLLRAAMAATDDGGPWLYIGVTDLTRRNVMHYLSVSDTRSTPHRLQMLSGAEALAFAVGHGWVDPFDPTVTELRGLIVHAMLNNDAAMWHANLPAWEAWVRSSEFTAQRVQRENEARSALRTLRWKAAEKWLSRA